MDARPPGPTSTPIVPISLKADPARASAPSTSTPSSGNSGSSRRAVAWARGGSPSPTATAYVLDDASKASTSLAEGPSTERCFIHQSCLHDMEQRRPSGTIRGEREHADVRRGGIAVELHHEMTGEVLCDLLPPLHKGDRVVKVVVQAKIPVLVDPGQAVGVDVQDRALSGRVEVGERERGAGHHRHRAHRGRHRLDKGRLAGGEAPLQQDNVARAQVPGKHARYRTSALCSF